jgi:NADPH:quinone reductase-like Zn-dependent oxidoreductase
MIGMNRNRNSFFMGALAMALSAALTTSPVQGAAPKVPAEQLAIVQHGYGGPEVLKAETVPVLEPGDGQVLLRVVAVGVNPVDWKAREGVNGRLASEGRRPNPPDRVIPGSDVAGVIVKTGPGVTDLKVGDAVAGSVGGSGPPGPSPVLNGAYSNYALASASRLVPKPRSLTFAQAAGLGTAGNTAALALRRLNVQAGQTLLVTGVAGGVGSAMAQLAKAQGARVIGTATPRHEAYLKSIGVDRVIDYSQSDWNTKVQAVDAVFDTVGGADGQRALGTLKKGGLFLGINTEHGEPSADQCVAAGAQSVGLRPAQPGDPSTQEQLNEVGRLVGEKKFTVHIDKTFPLERAADAQELSREGHAEGKIVIIVDRSQATRR